jgi:DNA-binding LytR/AlgR family response regulator
VNLDRVQGLELQRMGEPEVVLKSGRCLRLSRRYRKRFRERLRA